MKRWKAFWDGLNIRKAMVMGVLALYAAAMLITKSDMGVRDMLLMGLSYYFGYSNRQGK
jgi:hypothetical protein